MDEVILTRVKRKKGEKNVVEANFCYSLKDTDYIVYFLSTTDHFFVDAGEKLHLKYTFLSLSTGNNHDHVAVSPLTETSQILQVNYFYTEDLSI